MSIRSWFGFRRADRLTGRRSLLRVQRDSPRLQRVQEAAAEDVAAIEEDDQYFDPDSPGNQDPE